LRAEIPETIDIDGKAIDLRKRIDQFVDAAENHDLVRVTPEMLELGKLLDKSLTDFSDKVKNSKIKTNEAASQLEYYLGIKRALEIIKGFSGGSMKPSEKYEENKAGIEDKKRWLEYLKKMEES
jgi:hypothetical protein